MVSLLKSRPVMSALLQGSAFALLWGVLMMTCHGLHQLTLSPVTGLVTSSLAGAGFAYAMFRVHLISLGK